jgi:hypothetical protein
LRWRLAGRHARARPGAFAGRAAGNCRFAVESSEKLTTESFSDQVFGVAFVRNNPVIGRVTANLPLVFMPIKV